MFGFGGHEGWGAFVDSLLYALQMQITRINNTMNKNALIARDIKDGGWK